MKKVCVLVEEGFNVIAMDTEFPGIIYAMPSQQMAHATSWYDVLRENVNDLNLIQVGITLSNKEGVKPGPVHTWQFNMEFSLSKNKYSSDSINILKEAGIDFAQLEVGVRGGFPQAFCCRLFKTKEKRDPPARPGERAELLQFGFERRSGLDYVPRAVRLHVPAEGAAGDAPAERFGAVF